MDETVVNAITKLAQDAFDPQRRVVQIPGLPPGEYAVLSPGNEIVLRTIPLPRRANEAGDIDTLARVAVRMGENNEFPVEVWYSRAGVAAVETVTGERCRLALSPSPQLARLMEWDRAGRASLSQQELVMTLRTLFAGCVPPEVTDLVRNISTKKASDVNSQIQQGKVSLGKSMVAEMTGTRAIPERLIFTVPVFAQAAVPVPAAVRVEFDPDPVNERFTLIVIPGDVEAAFASAEAEVEKRVRGRLNDAREAADYPADAEIPVYRGSP